ncbi:MAG: hypothetical protein FWF90_18825 [Promicromonosporaceae bacterium]|nr:hypothetical protein [Promicromonosporaceae bacterium]
MTVPESSTYDAHRSRARAAVRRQAKAAEADRRARADRDAEVLAMLDFPGTSLASVAADVGLSKSMVAYIQRTAAATIATAEQARSFLARNPDA